MDSIAKINRILAERGMSGADLENLIGVSHSVYSQWNTRKTKPSPKSLAKVSEALGVPVSEIMDDAEELSAAFYSESLTKEEEDELWKRAKEFYDFLRQQKIKEKRSKK